MAISAKDYAQFMPAQGEVGWGTKILMRGLAGYAEAMRDAEARRRNRVVEAEEERSARAREATNRRLAAVQEGALELNRSKEHAAAIVTGLDLEDPVQREEFFRSYPGLAKRLFGDPAATEANPAAGAPSIEPSMKVRQAPAAAADPAAATATAEPYVMEDPEAGYVEVAPDMTGFEDPEAGYVEVAPEDETDLIPPGATYPNYGEPSMEADADFGENPEALAAAAKAKGWVPQTTEEFEQTYPALPVAPTKEQMLAEEILADPMGKNRPAPSPPDMSIGIDEAESYPALDAPDELRHLAETIYNDPMGEVTSRPPLELIEEDQRVVEDVTQGALADLRNPPGTDMSFGLEETESHPDLDFGEVPEDIINMDFGEVPEDVSGADMDFTSQPVFLGDGEEAPPVGASPGFQPALSMEPSAQIQQNRFQRLNAAYDRIHNSRKQRLRAIWEKHVGNKKPGDPGERPQDIAAARQALEMAETVYDATRDIGVAMDYLNTKLFQKRADRESEERNARRRANATVIRTGESGARQDRNAIMSDFKTGIQQAKWPASVAATADAASTLRKLEKNPYSPATWKLVQRTMVRSIGKEVGAMSNYDVQTAYGDKTLYQAISDFATSKTIGGQSAVTAADVAKTIRTHVLEAENMERNAFRQIKEAIDDDHGPGGIDEDPALYMRMYRHAERAFGRSRWWMNEKKRNGPKFSKVPGDSDGGSGASVSTSSSVGGDITPTGGES